MKPNETRKVVRSAPGWALGRPVFKENNGQAKIERIAWVQVVAWEVSTGDTGTSAWPVLRLESIAHDEDFVLRDPDGQIVNQEYSFGSEVKAAVYFQRRRNEREAKAQSQ